MTQVLFGLIGGKVKKHRLPDPEEELLPGVMWGQAAAVFSPAYWAHNLWLAGTSYQRRPSSQTSSLVEEIAFCLLGGYGITWEMNVAAFTAIKTAGLLERVASITQDSLEKILRHPLDLGGRRARYRFPTRKSDILARALNAVFRRNFDETEPRDLRRQLLDLPGVGWKTASWITRNWTGSDDVAIIDVHIVRAGRLMGLYTAADRVERDYPSMENRFVALAQNMRVSTAELDLIIWAEMRSSNHLAISMLQDRDRNEMSEVLAAAH